MDKTTLRKIMLNKRKSLETDECIHMSDLVFENFKNTEISDFENILVYADFKNEVKTDKIIEFLFEKGRAVYLPKCNTEDETFRAIRIFKESTDYISNKYGICEPTESNLKYSGKIDCVIVPGIAFDSDGNRIGFGCGYYDKFLNDNPEAFKAALCYDFQITDSIEATEHDIAMDMIISEKRIVRMKNAVSNSET